MPDTTSITAAISGIKTAMEIAKGFRESDLSYEKAEAKLKLADLMEALADAKINIADIKLLLQERDDEINVLRRGLEDKKQIVRADGVYFQVDEDGKQIDGPLCPKCWEVDHIQVHLNRFGRCPNCRNLFN